MKHEQKMIEFKGNNENKMQTIQLIIIEIICQSQSVAD